MMLGFEEVDHDDEEEIEEDHKLYSLKKCVAMNRKNRIEILTCKNKCTFST